MPHRHCTDHGTRQDILAQLDIPPILRRDANNKAPFMETPTGCVVTEPFPWEIQSFK